MSAESAPVLPQFENAEEETKYLKNLAFELLKEDKGLFKRISAKVLENMKRLEADSATASPSPKRRKLVDSLDPLNFNNICEDIQGLVMQHFGGKDLLAMSEVSKTWNNIVEAEKNEKTFLNLTRKKFQIENNEIITRKKYKKILMDPEALFSSTGSLFAQTVEELRIIGPMRTYPVNFWKLKSLKLHFHSLGKSSFDWIHRLGIHEVEHLEIRTGCYKEHRQPGKVYLCCSFCHLEPDDFQIWSDLIHDAKNLKSLDFDMCSSENIFMGLRRNGLQLEVLRFYHVRGDPNLCKTLKKLTVVNPKHLNFAFDADLKELTTLELEDYTNQDLFCYLEPEEILPVSVTIKDLSIKIKPGENIDFEGFNVNVMNLLKAVPKLETLYITKLTWEMMIFMAGSNLKLKTVKYKEIEGGTLEGYEEFKKTQQDINRDIQFIDEV